MKKFITLALGAALALSGVASAQPGYRSDYDRGRGHDSGYHGPGRGGPRMSVSARAQLRLRQLGYYRGPVDGSFGPMSRRALVRFQHDRRLPRTGWLDQRTIRALGIR